MFKRLLSILVIILLMISISSMVSLSAMKDSTKQRNYFERATWEEIFAEDQVVDYPIIFIHGIAGDTNHWEKTMRTMIGTEYFEMRYWDGEKIFHSYLGDVPEHWIWSISYYTTNPIQESIYGDLTLYAHRVERMIDLIKRFTKKDKVVIIAHSMGGLVSRKYMTLSQETWDSVHKIFTVGTPNLGVETSVSIVGQLKDLCVDSAFLAQLNQDWAKYDTGEKKWGVLGAIDPVLLFNPLKEPGDMTDSAGPRFIEISSAIPGEWEQAIDNIGTPAFDTLHYGFRIGVEGRHIGLLFHSGTFEGINWAIRSY